MKIDAQFYGPAVLIQLPFIKITQLNTKFLYSIYHRAYTSVPHISFQRAVT